MSKIQNEAVKSEAEVLAAGGTKDQLVNDTKIYVTANSINKRLDEAITDGDIGGGSGGSGGFDYITNGTAKDDTTGWVVYANTTAGTKPDDFGGVANVGFTWTRNTTTPLVSAADFLLTKPAANVQGNGIHYEFTAENGHLTLNLLLKMLADTSLLADGDMSVWLVSSNDSFVADFNVISANNPDILAGQPQIFKQLQLDASDTSYRLCIHWSSTTAAALTANFDSIEFGPSPVASGSIFNNVFVSGAGNAGTVLTANVTNIDFTETSDSTGSFDGSVFTASEDMTISYEGFVRATGNIDEINEYINGSSTRVIGFSNPVTTSSCEFSGIVNLSAGDTLSFRSSLSVTLLNSSGAHHIAITKVAELSENTPTSLDLGQRDVFASGAGNAGTALTANVTDVDFTPTFDNTSSFNGTQFTAKESITISYTGFVRATGAINEITEYINGVSTRTVGFSNPIVTSSCEFGGIVKLNAGDTFSLRSSLSVTLLNATGAHHIAITKIANPQTMLENEAVYATFASSNGQTVLNNNSIDWDVITDDSHDAYGAGLYTFPISGFYKMDFIIKDTTTSSSSYTIVDVDSGTLLYEITGQTGGVTEGIVGSYGKHFFKGEAVIIRNISGASRTLNAAARQNTFTIARIK